MTAELPGRAAADLALLRRFLGRLDGKRACGRQSSGESNEHDGSGGHFSSA